MINSKGQLLVDGTSTLQSRTLVYKSTREQDSSTIMINEIMHKPVSMLDDTARFLAAEGMHNDLCTLLRKLEVAGYLDAGSDQKL